MKSLPIERLLRKMLYSTTSFVLLSVPLAMYLYLFASSSPAEFDGGGYIGSITKAIPESGWASLLELATLLTFAHLRAMTAANVAIEANELRLGRTVTSFFRKLASTVSELENLAAQSSAGADFQAMLTASPTKGIVVSDLWAAHASRRAWAVR